jgi:hypothetical protein
MGKEERSRMEDGRKYQQQMRYSAALHIGR